MSDELWVVSRDAQGSRLDAQSKKPQRFLAAVFLLMCHECRGSVLRTPPPAWELTSFQDFFRTLEL